MRYLEQIECNSETFSWQDRDSWDGEKQLKFDTVVKNFDSAFNAFFDINFKMNNGKLDATGGFFLKDMRRYYEIDKNNNINFIDNSYSSTTGEESDISRLTRENLSDSYCIIDESDKSNNKIIFGTFKDSDNNTYTLTYGAKAENWLKITNDGTNPNPDPTYTNYSISRMYTKMTGLPDQEIPSTDPSYNIYKSTYGETIKLYSSKVEFSGVLTAPLNSLATYTKSGNNITFTDSTVSILYSATLDGNKFKLLISLSADMGVVIEYTATT